LAGVRHHVLVKLAFRVPEFEGPVALELLDHDLVRPQGRREEHEGLLEGEKLDELVVLD